MFDIFGKYHFACYEGFGKFCVSIGMFAQYCFCPLVLLAYNARHFFVNQLGAVIAVRFGKSVVLTGRVVVAQVWQFVTHAVVYHHGVSLFGYTFKVVGSAGGYAT